MATESGRHLLCCFQDAVVFRCLARPVSLVLTSLSVGNAAPRYIEAAAVPLPRLPNCFSIPFPLPPVYTLVFFGLAAMFAGNAGFYLSEVLRVRATCPSCPIFCVLSFFVLEQYPTGMANDPGNTFGMFADFGIAGMLVVFGIVALFKHAKYDADNTPSGREK